MMLEHDLVWDAHACLPLLDDTDVSALHLHHSAGVDFVSVNVGMDFNPLQDIFRFIAHFRNQIEQSSSLCFAETLADVMVAQRSGKLAVAFDLEGSRMLQDRPETVAEFYRLGVRQMHLAYNRNNSIAGGCHDVPQGLTTLGYRVLEAMEKVGMMVDCSHMSEQSTLDIMKAASKPVCFSHTNVRTLHDHGRCITDQQIKACAATGGVVGVSGVNRFHGVPKVSAADLAVQIDYIKKRVGIEHVGLGLDYMYPAERDDNPPGLDRQFWWPAAQNYSAGLSDINVCEPSVIGQLIFELVAHGYSKKDCQAVLGGNFYRVAQQCWR